MTPNPESTNGYVNNGYIGASINDLRIPQDEPSNGTLSTGHIYDINQNQIALTEFRKVPEDAEIGKGGTQPPPTGPLKECHAQKETADYEIQSAWAVLRQMLIPFLIAGFGSVFAGIVLNAVTKWTVFTKVP